MLKLNFTHDAHKFVRQLDPKQFRQVMNKILDLLSDPLPHDSIEMKSSPGYHRTDIGEFRVIYKFDKENLGCVVVGRRNDDAVYSAFERRKK